MRSDIWHIIVHIAFVRFILINQLIIILRIADPILGQLPHHQ